MGGPIGEGLARAGLAARGVIYAIVGILALELALGVGGQTTNHQGALKEIAQQPFGKVLLVVVAIGLLGYALWRLARAAVGHGIETGDDDVKERVSGLVSGITYGILCATAIQIIAGSGSSGGGAGKATGGVLGWPGGQVIVAIAGIALVGAGVQNGVKGVKKQFLEDSKTERMSEGTQRVFTWAGVLGYLARMVVFALVGYFLFKAAIDYEPDEAVTLDGALAKLSHATLGPLALGIVAAGLIGFACYSAMDARYRRV